MSNPRVTGSRMTRYATIFMLVLGIVTILINVEIAVVIIALSAAMFFFEWWLVRKVARGADDD